LKNSSKDGQTDRKSLFVKKKITKKNKSKQNKQYQMIIIRRKSYWVTM